MQNCCFMQWNVVVCYDSILFCVNLKHTKNYSIRLPNKTLQLNENDTLCKDLKKIDFLVLHLYLNLYVHVCSKMKKSVL